MSEEVSIKSPKDPLDDFSGMFGISERFAVLNRLITRDLNKNPQNPVFQLYSKDDITKFLNNPATNEKQLRDAITYIYGASSHFRRLIEYFVGLTDLAYVVSPYKVDAKKQNVNTAQRNFKRVCDLLSSMNIRTQFPRILTVCFREDTFYGTMHVSNESITIQQLPSEYCAITSIEGNVFNVSFDFSYFDTNTDYLEYYPPEFKTKYSQYQKNRMNKWIELASPTTFAVKANPDIPNYALPPFAGVLRDIYDIEDYRQLKITKTAIENYAMIVMKLGIDEDGNWEMPLDQAKMFWRNLDSVLPEEIGSILTPMPVDKISFERTHTGDTNTIAEAEQALYSSAGVSSLLFNNEKASGNALNLSIKTDQSKTFQIVRSLEDVVNRYLASISFGKNFRVTFLDVSPYNRKEMGDQYLKGMSYGLPYISLYAASQGLLQSDIEAMNFLENDILGLPAKLTPLQNSSTMASSTSGNATGEAGAPKKDIEELSDSREQNQELE